MKLAISLVLSFSLFHSTLCSWSQDIIRGDRILDINVSFDDDGQASIDPRYIDLPPILVEEISVCDTASINIEEDYAIITFSSGNESSTMELYFPSDAYLLMRILELLNNFEIEVYSD